MITQLLTIGMLSLTSGYKPQMYIDKANNTITISPQDNTKEKLQPLLTYAENHIEEMADDGRYDETLCYYKGIEYELNPLEDEYVEFRHREEIEEVWVVISSIQINWDISHSQIPIMYFDNIEGNDYFIDSTITFVGRPSFNWVLLAMEGTQIEGNDIVTPIASGLTLITDITNAFLNGFTSLFWDTTNNVLTPFASFSLIMLSVATVFAIIKLTMNIIRSNSGA